MRHQVWMQAEAQPTFGDQARSIEVHLFGVEADLYDQWVRVEWVERLRDVQRFSSVEQLKQQLAQDRAAAVDALARDGSSNERNRASHA